MPDDTSVVVLEIGRGIARLTLNRPARRNAIDAAMHTALREALDRIEMQRSIGALIVAGAGGSFCSGQDLNERVADLAEDRLDLRASLETNYNPLVRRLAALPFPVIAAVTGVAAGAGAALAIGCDIVLASPSARFHFTFAKMALGLDAGSTWHLPRLVGQGRALALALTAEPIGAEEAQRIGLVWKVFEEDALDAEAERLAHALADGPREALAVIKSSIRAASGRSLDEILNTERDAQGRLGHEPDYGEAVTAFIEKRAPCFSGERISTSPLETTENGRGKLS